MKEFEFDDIEISDEKDELIETKEENMEDPLYKKFSFDIDTDEEIENIEETKNDFEFDVDVKEEETKNDFEFDIEEELEDTSINNLFEEKEDVLDDKPLFSNVSNDIDNPFVKKEEKEEVDEKEQIENLYKDVDKNLISKEEISKEDALEEALSHTTKFSPFVEDKPKVSEIDLEDSKDEKESKGVTYLIVLFIILLIAIFVIPKIASLL